MFLTWRECLPDGGLLWLYGLIEPGNLENIDVGLTPSALPIEIAPRTRKALDVHLDGQVDRFVASVGTADGMGFEGPAWAHPITDADRSLRSAYESLGKREVLAMHRRYQARSHRGLHQRLRQIIRL